MAKKRDTREAILAAMLELVVERGFHNAPMAELAKRSGASPGVIYHYFPSKDALIHAVHAQVAEVKHKALFAGYSKKMPPREALLQVWLNAYRFYRSHPVETRFLDQYQNSPFSAYCEAHMEDEAVERIQRLMRPKKKGGMLKDLPPEAIHAMTLGLAGELAKAKKEFSQKALREIADTLWAAIGED
ncbi:MAG TPA: TetR/AcrR family transcriptional regulator [Terracidiphilus sp.]|nr:TetR/AcrR family transcriptional regulator [Terracidiphilus sp.]